MTPGSLPPGVPPYGSSYSPPPYIPAPYRQAYAAPLDVPPRAVPSGRGASLAWTVGLIVLVIGATALAAGAKTLATPPPAAGAHVVYAGNLINNDGAWTLKNDSVTTCAFTSSGLDVTASSNSLVALYNPCQLASVPGGDIRVSVRLAPAAAISGQFSPAIFLHNTVAFIFLSNDSLQVYQLQSDQSTFLESFGLTPWHGSEELPNDVIIANQGSIYTIAVNGTTIYQGDFSGAAKSFSNSGGLGLGVRGISGVATEAIFTDLSVTTP